MTRERCRFVDEDWCKTHSKFIVDCLEDLYDLIETLERDEEAVPLQVPDTEVPY